MESKLSPNSAALINKITELEETTEVRIDVLITLMVTHFSKISKSVISQSYHFSVLVL